MHGKKPTRTPACSGFYRSSPPPCKPESRRFASTLPCQRHKVHHGEGGALKRSNLHENCLPFSVKPASTDYHPSFQHHLYYYRQHFSAWSRNGDDDVFVITIVIIIIISALNDVMPSHLRDLDPSSRRRGLMERYGTKADLVSEVLEQITDKQEEEKINKRKDKLRLLLKPDADEARTWAKITALAPSVSLFALHRFSQHGEFQIHHSPGRRRAWARSVCAQVVRWHCTTLHKSYASTQDR